jgi:hypothetical protein
MDKRGARQVTPKNTRDSATAAFVENFTSGYMQRALESWPKQGSKPPWRVHQNYIRDIISLKWTSVADGVLEFSSPPQKSSTPAARELAEAAK